MSTYPVTYLAKLGELTLKGGNRKEFEQQLVQNARLYLESVSARVQIRTGRLYIEGTEESSAAIEFTLKHLIGITGWARARVTEKELSSIRDAVFQEAQAAAAQGAKSFKIEVRRSDKTFPLNSYELAAEAAEPVYEQKLLAVDVHNPDLVIRVEVRERCYVYSDGIRSCRGLPVGTGGKGLLLLSGGLDSPVAGYRMARRGMKIDCVYFHAYPYTSAEAQKKVEDLAQILSGYSINTRLNIIPFTAVQMRIRERAPEAFTTLLLRMCMMKAASMTAERIGAKCLITGESLGQVASQTVENMAVTEAASEYPLLRPLVGLDKEEIILTSKEIGSYDTSILPYEDCCVLFSPRHPVLRASVEEAMKLYQALEADDLIAEAFAQREVKRFSVRDYVAEKWGQQG
ncbi:MAG: tRNA 4-thiouridine(8) synthase ThiI [Spirochaetaceae bacterium]|jgi:thiamine biosynthesis protein ThiI|nr:tRNA 4-thiouridine(8) synthase ThiI [Spirochaetaceae bacterium]